MSAVDCLKPHLSVAYIRSGNWKSRIQPEESFSPFVSASRYSPIWASDWHPCCGYTLRQLQFIRYYDENASHSLWQVSNATNLIFKNSSSCVFFLPSNPHRTCYENPDPLRNTCDADQEPEDVHEDEEEEEGEDEEDLVSLHPINVSSAH